MREIIRKEAIRIHREKQSWEEAVRICGGLLQELGSVEEDYVQGMIEVIHQYGPYIVVAPHIAIAHAAAGRYVMKDDLALVVFKEPVIFHSENDPVHLVFGLCALEAGNHMELLSQLAEVMEEENVWEKFLACSTVTELYDLLNNEG